MDRVRLRLRGIFLLLCALPGCAVVDVGVRNPVPGLETVAVAPFFNLSQERTVNGREFALAYYSELQKVPGFEVLPVGVAERAMIDNGLTMESPDDALALARILGVDAVVIGAVTDYDPYSPRVGLKVAWYSPKQWLFLPNAPDEKLDLAQRSERPLPGLLRAQSPEIPATVSEIPDIDEGNWETVEGQPQGSRSTASIRQTTDSDAPAGSDVPADNSVPADAEFLMPRRVDNATRQAWESLPRLSDAVPTETPVPDPRPLTSSEEPPPTASPQWSPRNVSVPAPAVRISQLPGDAAAPGGASASPGKSPGGAAPPAASIPSPGTSSTKPPTDDSATAAKSPLQTSRQAPPPMLSPEPQHVTPGMKDSAATPPTLLFAAPPVSGAATPLSDADSAAIATDDSLTIPALVFDDHVVLGREDFNPREPLMAYVRMFDSTDARLVSRLADYLELSGETRSGDLEAYMKRSDFFRKFTAHVMISEMLMLHGGESRRRFLLKQRRYK